MNVPNRQPDPGEEFADFLDWLLKHHHIQRLKDCEIKKKSKPLWSNINFKQKVKEMGVNNIVIQNLSSRGDAAEVIRIIDQNWAKDWANYYKWVRKEYPRGHHGQEVHNHDNNE